MAATTTRAASSSRTSKASVTAAARMLAEIRRVAELLKQVSDPTRLQVLMLLSERERNVTELCADLGTQSQPAVSHHLALLRHGRLIEPRRSGKHNYYALTEAGRELAQVVDTVVG
ncbi:HTH-type transcriptional regulator KmtR [Paludisphaera borealis]|jgi:DNA-binding transcriptional ArsR family regulator|uniref:HTH-type transcriptional regulator KmtR n=2 Tax=Paludisphaera borealis TaxID=1387353 RepID=A0A1U7CMI3_9BACT|nr:metalloregulator ArsR/SmtB family transcription factor [Paludisphaera borealis]APW60118.1 HTH-type transcriptional regulator KmtR [Paludisphaera borealis]MDR3621404.1 metalloregulator ArsR/SmtB family transcription factor [Paludisphaera borealis]